MESLGVNWTLAAVQVVNIVLFVVWIALAVRALRRLRDLQLPPTPAALWGALIVLVPLLGASAFLIVNPRAEA
jgi:uncharacterized membrane protein YhaH (DUF805 family)